MAWFRTESEICSRDGRRIASGPGSVADVLERATSEGVNLSGADLRGQDLSRRSLVHARLECADLAGANLSHADLSRAVLEEANLAGAVLRHTILEETNFRRAYAEAADFGSASGREPDFMEANLTRADLSGASLPQAVFIRAKLARAVMVELQAPGSVFRSAVMERVEMPGSNLSRSDLSCANLFGANLTKAIVAGASFEGARLVAAVTDGVDFGTAVTRGAEFGKRAVATPGRRQLEALVATGRFPEALDAIGEAHSGRDTPPHVEFIAAMAHEGLGDFDRAADCYARAGRSAPSDARYPRELARVLLVLGRPSEAAEAYAREAQLSPGQPLPVARAAAARAVARGSARSLHVRPEREPTAQPEAIAPTQDAPSQVAPATQLVVDPHVAAQAVTHDRQAASTRIDPVEVPDPMPGEWPVDSRVPMSVLTWRDQELGRDLALVRLEARDVPDETFGRLNGIAREAGGRYGRSPDGERGFLFEPETASRFVARFGAEIRSDARDQTPRERVDMLLAEVAAALEESPPKDMTVGDILSRVAGIEEARLAIHEWLDDKRLPSERDPLRILATGDLLESAARESEAVRDALLRAGLTAKSTKSAHIEVARGL